MHCRHHIKLKFYKSTSELPDIWDRKIPQEHFLSRKNLLLTENSQLPDIRFLYVLVYQKNEPVAAAAFQLLHIHPYHIAADKFSLLSKSAWQVFSKLLHPKLLVAGHLFRHDVQSFYIFENTPDFEAYRFYQSAIKSALKKSCANAVLVKDMPDNLIRYFQHYAPEYLMLRNDISMKMHIDAAWKNIEDYEAALKHKYAQRFRKTRSPWAGLNIKELTLDEVKKEKETIYQLYLQVSKHQQVRFGYISKEYIPQLKENHEEDFHVWMAYENHKPVAFFSAWTAKEVMDMFYIGFDYERNQALKLYFNILFFAVEKAIEYQKSTLVLGRTALEAKARVGCKAVYLSTFLYIKNNLIRKAMLRLQQNVTEEEGEWENRHPFK